jgi:hypothetical protein
MNCTGGFFHLTPSCSYTGLNPIFSGAANKFQKVCLNHVVLNHVTAESNPG